MVIDRMVTHQSNHQVRGNCTGHFVQVVVSSTDVLGFVWVSVLFDRCWQNFGAKIGRSKSWRRSQHSKNWKRKPLSRACTLPARAKTSRQAHNHFAPIRWRSFYYMSIYLTTGFSWRWYRGGGDSFSVAAGDFRRKVGLRFYCRNCRIYRRFCLFYLMYPDKVRAWHYSKFPSGKSPNVSFQWRLTNAQLKFLN